MVGRSLLKWRNLVCLFLTVILPVSLIADDSAAAILRSDGIGIRVNNNPVPASIALFPHALVETQKNAVARLEATGSAADINPETTVRFEGDELVLDHGSVSVNTSRGMKVRVGCLTVTPVNDAQRTHYQVNDENGRVTVAALKSDVYLDARSSNLEQAKQSGKPTLVTVQEGEQTSRSEKCGEDQVRQSRRRAADGPFLDSPWAIAAGGVLIGLVACLGLCHGDDPVSPWKPEP